jgi:hypothetical protein
VGLFFDETSWDGSDLFQPQGTLFVLVRDSVRRALEEAKVRNVAFERITDIERTTAKVNGEIVYAPLREPRS